MAWARLPYGTKDRFSRASHPSSHPSSSSDLKSAVGKHFLTNAIHFFVGALMAWWWCERIRLRGPMEIIWKSSTVGHGKSQWNSTHLFTDSRPPRPISESGISQDPMAWLSLWNSDGNIRQAHRQGTPRRIPCLKSAVGKHFLTTIMHFSGFA